jgi:hypothetical protein
MAVGPAPHRSTMRERYVHDVKHPFRSPLCAIKVAQENSGFN